MSDGEKSPLEVLLPELKVIPKELLMGPTMPVEIYATEGRAVGENLIKDRYRFGERNIDARALSVRFIGGIEALVEAELHWSSVMSAQKAAGEQWSAAKIEAYDLRDEAFACFDYVIPEEGPHRATLEEIMDGTGHNDMIMDLGKLHLLSKEFTEELAGINFTVLLQNRLGELHESLSDLYGKVVADKGDVNEERVLRDRAFVYCHSILAEVKKAAKLVFRKDREALGRYSSGYQRRYNRRRQKESGE